jgi:hypothetical protein
MLVALDSLVVPKHWLMEGVETMVDYLLELRQLKENIKQY